uniref:WD_REPEATS_REGION domain-containing protein n=1 Tax=Parastrongyloides trichosuri TaxID=131310 RepID=A0A0N5A214_PARTI
MTKSSKKTGHSEIVVEQSNLFLTEGYSTTSLSANTNIYKLCAVRKLDNSERSISVVELWNIMDMPNMVLELSIPLLDVDVEACTWVGNYAICTATNGIVYQINSFTGNCTSCQICPSPLWCIKDMSDSKFLLGSDNGIVYVCIIDEGDNDKILIKSRINIDMETRILSIAFSPDSSTIGIGIVDSIVFIKLMEGIETKRFVVKLPKRDVNVEVLVWSLAFSGKALVSGDSLGRTCLWNSKNGSLIKMISSHQGDVLALAVDGTDIFASGTDYRIQVISALTSQDKKFDYATKGQRIIHCNDVRALASFDKWLISGGAEHELYVSKKHEKVRTFGPKNLTRISKNSKKVVFMHSSYIEIWERASTDFNESTKINDSYSLTNLPQNLIRIDSPKKRFICEAQISPNGKYVALSTDKMLYVYQVDEKSQKPVVNILTLPGRSTSILLEDDFIVWATGNFSILKYNFETKNEIILVSVKNSFVLFNLEKNEDGTLFVGRNNRNQLIIFGRDNCEDVFSTINVPNTITGYKFIKENIIVVSTTSSDNSLMLYNLNILEHISSSISYKSLFGKDQNGYIDGLEYDNEVNKLVVVSENNWKIISGLNQGSPVLETLQLEKIEKNSSKKCYIVPKWVDGTSSTNTLFLSYCSIALLPSNVPCDISRYGRN